MRTLYKYLVHLHPPAFRRQFASEMLLIFDEAAASAGALALILDCCISIARQWVLRSGMWKLAVAVMGACVQITIGGLIWPALLNGRRSGDAAVHTTIAMSELMKLILWSACAVVLMVIAVSLWVKSFIDRRTAR